MRNPDRTVKHGSLFIVAAVMAVAISISSCGSRKEGNSTAPVDDTPPANPAAKPVDAATAGSVAGIIKFDGVPPKRRTISMAAVANCAKMHSSPALTESVVPGDNGTLQNVVVYLRGDFSQYSFDAAKSPAMIDQNGCVYSPHVLALASGQQLRVTNSDDTTHNIHAAPMKNRGWNESQPPQSSPINEAFARPEIGISVKCNVHPWMKAYISVFSNPYFQVTGKDGSFKFDNVPPGTYTLTAWHEQYGTKEQTVTIVAKQEQSATITYTDRDSQ
jgi:plastocyanin